MIHIDIIPKQAESLEMYSKSSVMVSFFCSNAPTFAVFNYRSFIGVGCLQTDILSNYESKKTIRQ
jgi:hypothetical protein